MFSHSLIDGTFIPLASSKLVLMLMLTAQRDEKQPRRSGDVPIKNVEIDANTVASEI